ncbi:MAG: six-cysteine ranthipeptide SCIFF [Clostridiales bacterium]|nr:six-cysteine ranthipeptide SCIFF [Clostridiales bacterium]MDE5562136.1 six-cysteine ranthipeptide SCIFF [Clostridiales bacterium]MDE6200894.1 six-cysteine ranthipeptide SCIFF [Clostridiales bacterium]MDE6293045.1 six-cysteine ranthipeptide SCIFF [Clostridiales bacterium]MDE6618734.1 six-cysteine ranthipeptide SCIFF [Clostridiales bacterium]
MAHIKVIRKSTNDNGCDTACGECQTSCQSACKTSCTVGNQSCERKTVKVLNSNKNQNN